MKSIHAALALCSALLPLASAQAACPTDLEAAAMAAAIVARQTVPQPAGELSMADGQCGRDKVVRYLAQAYGETVGYKAGLTNPAVQKRFKYDAPLRGTLFKSMLAIDGAELPAASAPARCSRPTCSSRSPTRRPWRTPRPRWPPCARCAATPPSSNCPT